MACRLPTKRLKIVDLPTFGRPTMATTGRAAWARARLGMAEPYAAPVVGVDPSEGLIAFAKNSSSSGLVSFEVGDAQKLRFEDGSFDHAMAMLVMNFIPDHDKALELSSRSVHPDLVVDLVRNPLRRHRRNHAG